MGLQLGPHIETSSSSSSVPPSALPSQRPSLLACLIRSWHANLAEEALHFLRRALSEQAPLVYLSVGGLAMAAELLGHIHCPAESREAAADCVCQSLVSSGLNGVFIQACYKN